MSEASMLPAAKEKTARMLLRRSNHRSIYPRRKDDKGCVSQNQILAKPFLLANNLAAAAAAADVWPAWVG